MMKYTNTPTQLIGRRVKQERLALVQCTNTRNVKHDTGCVAVGPFLLILLLAGITASTV